MVAILRRSPPRLQFRPMLRSDIAEIMQIERSAYAFPWTEGTFLDCLRVGYAMWVLMRGDPIGAYGVVSLAAGEAHILNVCVKPLLHGQGLGRILMEHLIDDARARGAEIAFLEVRPSNVLAIELYRRLGFAEVGLRRAYYPAAQGREDALVMAIQLSGLPAR